MQYLNSQNIIYRDLKPENILIFQDGYPKLADFGIVYRTKDNELCYGQRGTIIYFSPEMAMNKGYNKGHDLWTLGILIYELMFGEIPFETNIIDS